MASTVTDFTPKRIQLSATPSNCTEIILPQRTKEVAIQFIANDGKLAYVGTDDAAIGSDYLTLPANNIVSLQVGGRAVLYLASATASCVVEVLAFTRTLGD